MILEFNDYRKFIRARIKLLPQLGRGQLLKISLHLRMQPSLLSQILNGKKNFTSEQAVMVTEYFKLSDLDADYFVKLVELERAGSPSLRRFIERQLSELKAHALEIKSRLPKAEGLTKKDQALFYSSWKYSLLRLLSSIGEARGSEELAQIASIDGREARAILEFLAERNLCVEKHGKYSMGAENIHVENKNPLSTRHHLNWRTKMLEWVEARGAQDFCFTGPMTISVKDFELIRKRLLALIEEVGAITLPSRAETFACLTIDFLRPYKS